MDRPRISIRLFASVVVLLGTVSLNNAMGQGFYTHPDLPNGHQVVGPPAIASWGRGRLDFVVTGDDGLVYHRYWAKKAPNIGATFVQGPLAHVVGIGRKSPPKETYGPPEGWEAYPALPNGHRVVGPPAIASWGFNRLDFVVTGDDGLVYHRYWANAYGPAEGWEAYPALPNGRRVVGPPAIASWGADRLDFVVTGDDGLVYHRYWANAYGPAEGWRAYPALPNGRRVVGPPAIASWGPDRLDFVVTGDDGLVYHRYWANAYGPAEEWEAYPALPNGRRVVGPREIISRAPDRLSFFVTCDDGHVYHRYWDNAYGPAKEWNSLRIDSDSTIGLSRMKSENFVYASASIDEIFLVKEIWDAAKDFCKALEPVVDDVRRRMNQGDPFADACSDYDKDSGNAAGERYEKNERGGKKIAVFTLLH